MLSLDYKHSIRSAIDVFRICTEKKDRTETEKPFLMVSKPYRISMLLVQVVNHYKIPASIKTSNV